MGPPETTEPPRATTRCPTIRLDAGMTSFFTENRGQFWWSGARLYASGEPLSVAFGTSCVWYLDRDEVGRGLPPVRISFEGSRPTEPTPVGPLDHRSNFFFGDDPDRWVPDACNYEEVWYRGLYDGVDLRYRFSDGMLKYEFRLAPGTDPATVQISYDGVQGLEVEDGSGDLLFDTGAGTVRDAAPYAYQERGGERTHVACTFVLQGSGTVAFSADGVDPGLPLVIDPGIVFSTYLGGTTGGTEDTVHDLCMDGKGNIYVTGSSTSNDFPTTAGTLYPDTTVSNTFVLKMTPDGSDLVYSTFIAGGDYSDDIAVDGNGWVYVIGSTQSQSFPTTSGAYRTSFPMGTGDWVYAFKLNPRGSQLGYSTFIGPGATWEMELVPGGSVYLVGFSNGGFPTTPGAFDRTDHYTKAFVTRLNPTGSGLVFSTLLGATPPEYEITEGTGIALGPGGAVYVAGVTWASTFPTTAGAYDTTYNGQGDYFIAKLEADCSALKYSTYIGGSSEEGIGVAWSTYSNLEVDDEGCAYFASTTSSVDFPATEGVVNNTSTRWVRAFALKLGPDGTGLEYSTFLSGNMGSRGTKVQVDDAGRAYVIGRTSSSDFPVTDDAFQRKLGGSMDAFLSVLNEDASELVYSTYLGGSRSEWVLDIFLGAPGLPLLGGVSEGDDFPTTMGAYQPNDPTPNPYRDGFITLFDIIPPDLLEDRTPHNATTGDPLTFEVGVSDNHLVSSVAIEHSQGGGHNATLPLSLASGDARSGVWEATLTVPPDSLEPINYTVRVMDRAGNAVVSAVRKVNVTDNDLPSLEDLTVAEATTGEGFPLSVDAQDNIGMSRVKVHFWFGKSQSSARNRSMTGSDILPDGNGRYAYEILIPVTALASLSYFYEAWDTSGNRVLTDTVVVEVVDNDGPLLVEDLTGDVGTTGDPFTFRADLTDPNGVSEVHVHYWYMGGDPVVEYMRAVAAAPSGNGTYAFQIRVPDDMRRDLQYYVRAVDGIGNWLTTDVRDVDIVDNDAPTLGSHGTDPEAVKGMSLSFHVGAFDNIAVWEVFIEYRFGTGSVQNESMVGMDTYSIELDLPRHGSDEVRYSFSATDSAGNWNSTGEFNLTLVNLPPELGPISTWVVTEEEDASRDMKVFISDGNDDLGALVLTCDDERIDVDGLILRTSFPEWVPEFETTVTLSDGEDEVSRTFAVRVVNVNDPPVITTGLQEEYVVDTGDTLQLALEGTDVEGDPLVWTDDTSLFDIDPSTGEVLFVPTEAHAGLHVVTITLTDGNGGSDAVSFRLVVRHEEGPSGNGGDDDGSLKVGTGLLLLLVLVIAVVTAVAVWYARRYGD